MKYKKVGWLFVVVVGTLWISLGIAMQKDDSSPFEWAADKIGTFTARIAEAHDLEERTREIAKQEAIAVVDSALTDGPIDPPTNPPPIMPPPDAGACDDLGGLVSDFHSKCVADGFWEGFATGSVSKLRDDGSNRERNATIKSLDSILGLPLDTMLDQGAIEFLVKLNAAALETGGGGKHLMNLASTPLSRGGRDVKKLTRIEIASPGGPQARIVLHNYNEAGQGGAREIGKLGFHWIPDEYIRIQLGWAKVGNILGVFVNGQTFETTLLPGSEGPGRYWGSGHMETMSGGGVMSFTLPEDKSPR